MPLPTRTLGSTAQEHLDDQNGLIKTVVDAFESSDPSDFALAAHNHDADYADIAHNHTGVYAPDAHTHTEVDVTDLAHVVGVSEGGAAVGTRPEINFIEGTNVTLTITDNAGADRVDVTIAASGGGGGATAIDDLTDVDTTTTTPTVGDTLQWDGSNWVPVAGSSSTLVTINVDDFDLGFATLGGGSGMAIDPVDDRWIYAVGDDPTEGPDNSHVLWASELDDPVAPTAATLRYKFTGVVDNDNEAVSFVFFDGDWVIAVWSNATDTVTLYARPTLTSGATEQTLAIGSSLATWAPSNGVTGGNTESMRYNVWDDKMYFIRNRGAGGDDNDNDRELWESVAGWSTATPGSMPSTTLTQVNNGNFVTRPESSSPVPNAQGDFDFIGEHIIVAVGVATNTTPTPDVDNDYVMAWIKDTDESWTTRFSDAGAHFPDVVLARTNQSNAVNEHCAVNWTRGYMFMGPELDTSSSSFLRFTVRHGGTIVSGNGAGGSGALPTGDTGHTLVYTGAGSPTTQRVFLTPEMFGAVGRNSADQATALQAWLDELVQGAGAEWGLLTDLYQCNTVLDIDPAATGGPTGFMPKITGAGPQGWGLSGNAPDTDPSGNGMVRVGFAVGGTLDTLIDVRDGGGSPDWRGIYLGDFGITVNGARKGSGTYVRDYLAKAIKVRDVNGSVLERLSFSEQHDGVAISIEPDADNNPQFTQILGCNTAFVKTAVQVIGDKGPDLWISRCNWTGVSKGDLVTPPGGAANDDPVAGHTGMYFDTNAVYVEFSTSRFFSTHVDIDGATSGHGKHIFIVGGRYEADQDGTGTDVDEAFLVRGASVDNLMILAPMIGNSGKFTDVFEVQATVAGLRNMILFPRYDAGFSNTLDGEVLYWSEDQLQMYSPDNTRYTLSPPNGGGSASWA